jgi:hypothetical protein
MDHRILTVNFLRGARVACFLVFALAGACSVLARAQDQNRPGSNPAAQSGPQVLTTITAVPNRPTFSTTAETVQTGVFEIEYGLEAADGHQNINGLLKFGLFKNLELRFGNNPIERDAGIAGRGDSGAGLKYRFLKDSGPLPTISLLYNATLPTATAGLGSGSLGHSAGILVSKDFGKHHMDFNESLQWLGRPGASGFDRDYFTALSYSHPVTEKLGFTAEIAGFSRANLATPSTLTILQALTYNISERLVIDSGCYVAARGDLPRITFFLGVTYSVLDLYRYLHLTHR